MNNPSLVEVTGTIKVIRREKAIDETMTNIEFVLLDTEGRLLALKYVYEDHNVSKIIRDSLKEGMNVTVLVKGPIDNSKATYEGIGIIRILKEWGNWLLRGLKELIAWFLSYRSHLSHSSHSFDFIHVRRFL